MNRLFNMNRLLIVTMLFLLGACTNLAPQDESSPFYTIPEQSKLIVNSDIVIPARELKVYVQGSRIANDAAKLYPYCIFELRERKANAQLIKPDVFTISRVSRNIDYIAGIVEPSFQLASNENILIISPNGGDGPGLVTYATYMYLHSPNQPEVLRLICAQLKDFDPLSKHLSIDQMRAALGPAFSLEVAR